MRCSEFLEHYSEYRDGLPLDPWLARRLYEHVRACPDCMRYDAQVQRGVMALRATSDLEPSPRFRRRLNRALAAELLESPNTVRPAAAGALVGIMLTVAMALLLWEVGTHARRSAAAAPPAPWRAAPAVDQGDAQAPRGLVPLVAPAATIDRRLPSTVPATVATRPLLDR